MITIPCKCGAAVELPADDSSPSCRSCKQAVPVRWFRGRGRPGTKSYLNAFDVWRLHMIQSGRVRAHGEAGAR